MSGRDASWCLPRIYSDRLSNEDVRVPETCITAQFTLSERVQGNWKANAATERVKPIGIVFFWKTLSVASICILFGILNSGCCFCSEFYYRGSACRGSLLVLQTSFTIFH